MKNICFYHQTKIKTNKFYHKPKNHNKNITFYFRHTRKGHKILMFLLSSNNYFKIPIPKIILSRVQGRSTDK